MRSKETRTKALQRYSDMMREIKLRVSTIEKALNEEIVPARVLRQEFCFLQLRMICECIAIACLSVQSDISETSQLKKEWAADSIMARLERIHPESFPVPSEQGVDPETGMYYFREAKHSDCMNRDDIVRLWGQCGRYLHRGTFRNIFERRKSRVVEFDDIFAHCQRILNLLECHAVLARRGGDVFVILCVLAAEPDGRVKVMLAS